MTGVPHAIASIMTRPKGSGQSIGNSRPRALPRNSCFWSSVISPMNSTFGCAATSGPIFSRQYGSSTRSIFAAIFRRTPARRGDLDGAVRSLLWRNAAEECQIVAGGMRIETQQVLRQAVMDIADPEHAPRQRRALMPRNGNERNASETRRSTAAGPAGRAGRAAWSRCGRQIRRSAENAARRCGNAARRIRRRAGALRRA